MVYTCVNSTCIILHCFGTRDCQNWSNIDSPERVKGVGAVVVPRRERLLRDGGVLAEDAVPFPVFFGPDFACLPDLHCLLEAHGVYYFLIAEVLDKNVSVSLIDCIVELGAAIRVSKGKKYFPNFLFRLGTLLIGECGC